MRETSTAGEEARDQGSHRLVLLPAGGWGRRPASTQVRGHLAELGVEPHVLAPHDPRWIHSDPRLEVPPGVRVHRAPYFGPRGRLPAEELYGLTGTDRLLRRLALTPRRLLVPDENVTWALTGARRSLDVIRGEGIDAVLTTSPPSSIHLLGLLFKRRAGIPWIADLRDSLVAKNDRRFDSRLVRLKEWSDAPGAIAEFDRLRGRIDRPGLHLRAKAQDVAEELALREHAQPLRSISRWRSCSNRASDLDL